MSGSNYVSIIKRLEPINRTHQQDIMGRQIRVAWNPFLVLDPSQFQNSNPEIPRFRDFFHIPKNPCPKLIPSRDPYLPRNAIL